MKIKNVEELANVLGMAFRTYSATVATGRNIEPFLPLIDGAHTIIAEISLSDTGELAIYNSPLEKIVLPNAETAIAVEISKACQTELVETPLLEEAPVEIVEEVEQVEEKPKRKRRTI